MEDWGSWFAARMSSLTGTSVFFGTVFAYILWAIADRWVLHRGRKGPVQWPIIGATVELLLNFYHFNDWLVSYLLRDGLTMRCESANATYVCTADPANVEYILKTNFANYPKGKLFHEVFDTFLGDGIFNADGENWKQQRKTASFAFASQKLRDFSTVVYRDNSVKLAFMVTNACRTQQPLDMQDLFMRFTFDSIFKVAFGHEIETLKPGLPEVPFAKAFDTTNECSTKRFVNPFWKLLRFLKVGDEATVVASAKVVDDFTYNVIKARKLEVTIGTKGLGKRDFHTSEQSDLFTRIMLSNDEGGEQFTDKKFRDILLNFVLAGRDSTALTLSWFVYSITELPHVGDKLFHELLAFETDLQARNIVDNKSEPETLSGDDDFNRRVLQFSELLTFDNLTKLQYLQACIMETLRLYPPLPNNVKSAAADDVFPSGTPVQKGNMILYSAYAMGRMPAIWGPDATEFKPERWLVDGVVQPACPFKFTAFQAGPRICPGKDSAMLQMRMCLALLCRFFKFQLEPSCVVKYRQMASLTMANGLHVKMVKRCD